MWNARNGHVQIDNTEMDYVSFGSGRKNLVLIPGLSDGLATVKGKAHVLAPPYRMFFKDYTVFMFSRKRDLPEGCSIREMAADQAEAMKKLGMERAAVVGVSQGGMIAQYLAIDYPELVEKLVLAVSTARANETVKTVVNRWIDFARLGDYERLMIDTAELSYSAAYLRRYRKFYPLLGKIGKPESFQRFLANTDAILKFDALGEIGSISCPTFIIAGGVDKIVGVQASYELKENINGSSLYVYPELGHATYKEAKDFYHRIMEFLESDNGYEIST